MIPILTITSLDFAEKLLESVETTEDLNYSTWYENTDWPGAWDDFVEAAYIAESVRNEVHRLRVELVGEIMVKARLYDVDYFFEKHEDGI